LSNNKEKDHKDHKPPSPPVKVGEVVREKAPSDKSALKQVMRLYGRKAFQESKPTRST